MPGYGIQRQIIIECYHLWVAYQTFHIVQLVNCTNHILIYSSSFHSNQQLDKYCCLIVALSYYVSSLVICLTDDIDALQSPLHVPSISFRRG